MSGLSKYSSCCNDCSGRVVEIDRDGLNEREGERMTGVLVMKWNTSAEITTFIYPFHSHQINQKSHDQNQTTSKI